MPGDRRNVKAAPCRSVIGVVRYSQTGGMERQDSRRDRVYGHSVADARVVLAHIFPFSQ